MALKTRIAKLEIKTGGNDDFPTFKKLIEAVHEADPIDGFDEGYAGRKARRMCDAGETIASFTAQLQNHADSNDRTNGFNAIIEHDVLWWRGIE